MKYFIAIIVLMSVSKSCYTQNNFKGAITYATFRYGTRNVKSLFDTITVYFFDSSIITKYKNSNIKYTIDNFKTKENKVYFEKDSSTIIDINPVSVTSFISNVMESEEDTVKILDKLCKSTSFLYKKDNDWSDIKYTIAIKSKLYLSDLKYICPNVVASYDPIFNNGFGFIPLQFETESVSESLDKQVKKRTVFRALNIVKN